MCLNSLSSGENLDTKAQSRLLALQHFKSKLKFLVHHFTQTLTTSFYLLLLVWYHLNIKQNTSENRTGQLVTVKQNVSDPF